MGEKLTPDLMWVEKYRPRCIEDLVLSEENAQAVKKFLQERAIPHLLLVGSVGSGKTTIARMLLSNMDCTSLELNASDERGIDTVRNRVKGFLMTAGVSCWRVVFLDEADALTPDAQFSLRNVMERFSAHGRFVLTANYEEKIIEPLRSRCQSLHFSALPKREVFQRAMKVLKLEGVAFEVEGVMRVVDEHYPDVRKIINTLQLCTSGGKFTYKASVDVLGKVRGFLQQKDLRSIRELVLQERPDFTTLYRGLFDTLPELLQGKSGSLATAGVTIGEYLYRDSIVADREINFSACCLELMKEV